MHNWAPNNLTTDLLEGSSDAVLAPNTAPLAVSSYHSTHRNQQAWQPERPHISFVRSDSRFLEQRLSLFAANFSSCGELEVLLGIVKDQVMIQPVCLQQFIFADAIE